MHAVVVEDDERLGELLDRGLTGRGYTVTRAADGTTGLARALGRGVDVVGRDAMLPGIDGFDVSRRLRAGGCSVPVLLLTARDTVPDRVEGLQAGADDYLVKPFAFDELVARLEALQRRAPLRGPDLVQVLDLRIDLAARQAWRGDQPLALTPREFDLAARLARGGGIAGARGQLRDAVWGDEAEPRSNVVDVCVRSLRAKVDEPFDGPPLIETVRGVGYRMRRAS
jgi:DNA-binding response OmpR family regulator